MAVTSEVSRSGPYNGNGVTTVFPYTFKIFAAADLLVTKIDLAGAETTLVINTDYTVDGVLAESGGNVTLTTALAGDGTDTGSNRLVIRRVLDETQTLDLRRTGLISADALERALDRAVMLIQQIQDENARSLRLTESEAGSELLTLLPALADRKGRQLTFDPTTGQPTASNPTSTPVSAAMQPVVGAASTASAMTALGITPAMQPVVGAVSTLLAIAAIGPLESAVVTPSRHSVARTLGDAVGNALLALPTGIIPNVAASAKNISILGDSISHGAFAGNSFMHAWVRIFARMANVDLNSSSYGFVNLLYLGSGPTITYDVMSVNFSGTAWTWTAELDASVGCNYPSGAAVRAGDATSAISITVPFFQNILRVWYGTQTGGGSFKVYINGALATTVATAGSAGYSFTDIEMVDGGYGKTDIYIECISAAANPVDIIGVGYLASTPEPMVNNYSQSGRKLLNASQQMINAVVAESATLIMALGTNDQGLVDSDDTEYANFLTRIGWITTAANSAGVHVVVPDFLWTVPETSRTRQALRKLAQDTGGIYIDFPSQIFKFGATPTEAYLTTTLAMWADGNHPNKDGHKWIAETLAKRMGLSVTSKREAIRYHDWWMPLILKSATLVYNYFPANASLVSAYKRNGTEIQIKAFLRMAGGGAFPIGSYSITDAWYDRSELNAAQAVTKPAYVRQDTGAVVSMIEATGAGALTLNVIAAYLTQNDFTFTMPIVDSGL
jgi:hypothetical protein